MVPEQAFMDAKNRKVLHFKKILASAAAKAIWDSSSVPLVTPNRARSGARKGIASAIAAPMTAEISRIDRKIFLRFL